MKVIQGDFVPIDHSQMVMVIDGRVVNFAKLELVYQVKLRFLEIYMAPKSRRFYKVSDGHANLVTESEIIRLLEQLGSKSVLPKIISACRKAGIQIEEEG